jgi:hypothetical protein
MDDINICFSLLPRFLNGSLTAIVKLCPNSAMERVFHTRFNVNYAYKMNPERQICPYLDK